MRMSLLTLLAMKQWPWASFTRLSTVPGSTGPVYHDAGLQQDAGDTYRLVVVRHEAFRPVFVLHHVYLLLRREREEGEHLAGGDRHDQELLGVEERGVPRNVGSEDMTTAVLAGGAETSWVRGYSS